MIKKIKGAALPRIRDKSACGAEITACGRGDCRCAAEIAHCVRGDGGRKKFEIER
jgi:hypothetical protein